MPEFTKTPQWLSGSNVAAFLDSFFGALGWQITPTTPHEERVLCLGDRHYARGADRLTIEYKSGLQTAYTGNVFLETVSVDSSNKPGWVYTCQADYIFYAALDNHKILIFRPDTLRDRIDELQVRYRTLATSRGQNVGYKTHGVIVPLAVAELELAAKVIHL